MDILITNKSEDYELLDSGDGEKLEKFGPYILSRPENQAIWSKTLPKEEWNKANAVFTHGEKSGRWKSSKEIIEWQIGYSGYRFNLKLLPSKHVGLFPEQAENWKWLTDKIRSKTKPEWIETNNTSVEKTTKVLNLFAHTGGATLACIEAGAEVVHVDASNFSVEYAQRNLNDSGLVTGKVRFIIDDVRKFVEREIKRGNKYDIIILDPPVYGKGAKKEVWRIEKDLPLLLKRIKEIVSDNPIVLLNGYASVYSPVTYSGLIQSTLGDLGGIVTYGELTIRESTSGRLLPCGIFARFEKN